MSSDVFLVTKDSIVPVPSRTFADGVRSERMEAALQKLLDDYPDLIPGNQIAAGSDAPRFVLLEREGSVSSRWFMDHVFVDQFGIPTIVETKLFQNSESRREVIGQVLEYAANAVKQWGNGELRRRGDVFWVSRQRQLDDVIRDRFGGDVDLDAFWNTVEASLQANQIRIIVAADQLRPEVRRILEFLNEEMRNVEVFGLEVRCYVQAEGDLAVFVSQIVGQTQRVADQKQRNSEKIRWTRDRLEADFFTLLDSENPVRAARLRRLWDAMQLAGVLSEPALSTGPTFSASAPNGNKNMSIQNGTPHWACRASHYAFDGGLELRNRMAKDLLDLGMTDASYDNRSSHNVFRKLEELSEEEFGRFTQIATYYRLGSG